jgi:hypothetical protein
LQQDDSLDADLDMDLTRLACKVYIARCTSKDRSGIRLGANLHSNTKGISMKNIFVRYICRMLIVCMAAFPFSTYAGMVGTDQVVAAAQSQGPRDKLRNFVGRSEVSNQLQSLGISPTAAQARVSAMTDAEVASVVGKIDSLPAGGNTSGWAIVGVLLIIGLVWYYWIK